MKGAPPLLALSMLLVGCHVHEAQFLRTFASEDVNAFEANTDSGSVFVRGVADAEKLTVRGVSVAYGVTEGIAAGGEARNGYEVALHHDTVSAWADSRTDNGYVDFHVNGGRNLDTRIDVPWGHAEVQGVHGVHDIRAGTMTLRDVSGSARLEVEHGGLDAIIHPDPNGYVRVESECGAVSLGLPRGLDYDLIVEGDAWFPIDVEDLGFDTFERKGRRIEARSGAGTVRIDVDVTGAALEIYAID